MDEILKLKLFTIRQLTKFGINEKELRSWHKAGWLEPSAYAGSVPKFRYADFEAACQAQIEHKHRQKEKMLKRDTKRKSRANANSDADSFYGSLKDNFLNN